jgi:hypothetical protein
MNPNSYRDARLIILSNHHSDLFGGPGEQFFGPSPTKSFVIDFFADRDPGKKF